MNPRSPLRLWTTLRPLALSLSLSLALGLLCLAATAARAQPAPAAPKPATLRFLFLDETPGAYSIKVGATLRRISSAPYAISAPVIVPPRGHFEIYQTSPQPDPVTHQKALVKLADIAPPADIVSALVVVTTLPPPPDSTEPPRCTVAYFDNDIHAFPPGSVRVINLGRAPLGAQFDKATSFQLSPGQIRIVKLTPDAQDRIVARIAVSEGDSWRLLSNQILVLRPDQRLTGVFVYSPSGRLCTYTAEELAEFGKPKPGHFWITYTDTP